VFCDEVTGISGHVQQFQFWYKSPQHTGQLATTLPRHDDNEISAHTSRRLHLATTHSPQSTDGSQRKDFDEIDAHLLEQTVEKVVRYGQQVGVTPEEMISLLDSGISIRDLLAFLTAKSSGAA
jgi:hypothetical protein